MARRGKSSKAKARTGRKLRPVLWLRRGVVGLVGLVLALVLLFAVVNPPRGFYMIAEGQRHGGIERTWVPRDRISPNMMRAAVAAEDANFCLHWGFDMGEIRRALDAGAGRGASTISQQAVKNVFLWHGRSGPKGDGGGADPGGGTGLVKAPNTGGLSERGRVRHRRLWRRGCGAALLSAPSAADLTMQQAARLAAILPDPKGRSASRPSAFVQRRAAAIADGAATIRADGRDRCFLP
jgi:monofunctional glycosyltransferase